MELTALPAAHAVSRKNTGSARLRRHLQAIALACLASVAPAHALDVTGSITTNTKWFAADSPIIVTGAVTIESGAVLTIEPGVTVQFEPEASLAVVEGALSAQGTSLSPIVFDSSSPAPAPGDWGPLRFAPGTVDAGSALAHVQVRHGEGVVVHGAAPTFNHLHLEHNSGPAITLDLAASPVGRNLSANDNGLNGILVPAGQIDGDVTWALVGIPYVLQAGTVHVGAPQFGLAPSVLQLADGVTGVLELSLPSPATPGGLPVTVVSSVPSVASAPAQVIAPGGATAVQIDVQANAPGQTTISAGAVWFGNAQATVKVVPAPSLAFVPDETVISVGGNGVLTLELSDVAPAEGREVALDASPSDLLQLPDTVTVAPGADAVDVPLTGLALGSVTLQASAPGYVGATAHVQIKPASLNPPASLLVAPGTQRPLAIQLSDPAPPGGLSIAIDNSAPGVVTVPDSVDAAEGASSVQFDVQGLALGNAALTFSAPGYESGVTQVTVESIAIVLQPAGPLSIPKQLTSTHSVRLSKPAPAGGAHVALATGDQAIATVTPASVFVPQGQTVSAQQIAITAIEQGNTALLATSPGLVALSTPIAITQQARLEFTAATTIVGKGLKNYPYTVQVRRRVGNTYYEPPSPLTVVLSSSAPGLAAVQGIVQVPAGQSSTPFSVSGFDITNQPVEIVASAAGYLSSAALKTNVVLPQIVFEQLDGVRTTASQPDSLRIRWHTPGASDSGSQTAIADQTVALSIEEAAPAGIVPGFHDRWNNVTSQVTIAAGQNSSYSSNNQLDTYIDPPAAVGSYKVGASVAGIGSWTSATQTVSAPELSFSKSTVIVGKGLRNYTSEIYVQRRVNGQSATVSQPLEIQFASADPNTVGVPSSVTIPAGQWQTTFTVAGHELTENAIAITASAAGHAPTAVPLSASVVLPEIIFEHLDVARTIASQPDNFRVRWNVPGYAYGHLVTAIADQTIVLSIEEAAPAGIVPGFHDRWNNVTSQVTIAAGQNSSYNSGNQLDTYVDPPSTTGSYKIGASLAGIGSWTSATQTVSAPELKFSTASVIVGKGLRNYSNEVYVERRVNGQTAAVSQPLEIQLQSSDPTAVEAPSSITLPAGQWRVAFTVAGHALTENAVAVSASAAGHAPTAVPLSASVVLPEIIFEYLDGARTIASQPDNFRVRWNVPGYAYGHLVTAIADQTIALSIEEAAPAGIVPGFHDRWNNVTTQVTIAAGQNGSYNSGNQLDTYVDPPIATGSYKIGASLAGIGSWTSATQTVSAPELKFSKAAVIVGKGLLNYAYDVQVQRAVSGSPFNGAAALEVAVSCASAAICTTPPTLTIPANQSSAYLRITGTGVGATQIHLSAPGYTSVQALDVTGVLPSLRFNNLPAQLASGASANVTVSVATPGAPNGIYDAAVQPITVDLTSAQPGVATIPASVVIGAGSTTSPTLVLKAVAPGATTLTASGVDLTPFVSPAVTVNQP